jgi:hypothetical protein
MKIMKGTVVSKRDGSKNGWMTVRPDKATAVEENSASKGVNIGDTVEVKYVSPYGGGDYAGQVTMPESNQQILYCQAENDVENTYFYLGSIIGPTFEDQGEDFATRTGDGIATMPHDYDDYQINHQSMSYGIQTPLKQQVVLQEFRGLKGETPVNSKRVRVKSSRGHKLHLDDSTETKKVNLTSASQGAGLELRDRHGDNDPSRSPESAYLYGKTDATIRAWKGGLKMSVADGKNLQILNNSTGGNATSGTPAQKAADFGNIQIHTDRGDIVISSAGNGVFIDCFGGDPDAGSGSSFQVRSQNKIHLYSSNGIDLKSDGPVNIKGSSVNIEGNTIDLNPTASIDSSIGIRNTNANILQEKTENAPMHFFKGSLESNYCENSSGRNNDSRL